MKRFIHTVFLLSIILMATSVNAATSLSYVYDANGNLINGDGKYYEYNDANQLVRVKYGDQNGPVIAEYVYDYSGQRIKKIDNGLTTYYVGKHFETQTDGSNTQHTNYYFANGERVAKKDALGNMAYYHSDHLGGTNVITDSGGNLVERIKYYPFGEIIEGDAEKYQYTGKEKDHLTDWNYFEARYYNSDFKHFTQADTVEPDYYDPQDLNRYAYVRNNPLKLIDPNGHAFNLYGAIASCLVELPELTYNFVQQSTFTYYGVKTYFQGNYSLSDTYLKMADEETNKIRDSFASVLIGSFVGSGKGSTTATKMFGKTGLLKLIDMRFRRGILTKFVWAATEAKLKDRIKEYIMEKVDARQHDSH
jgi:RHS repeat-associated protein